MNLNKIVGLLLVIQGIWMTIERNVGFGFVVNREANGLALYGITIPLIFFGIYMMFYASKEDKKSKILNSKIIHVKLLDEDIDVYRPVQAIEIDDYQYKIIDDDKKAYSDFLEKWEFKKNDIVECEYKVLNPDSNQKKLRLVAVKKLNISNENK